jgi:lysophospholipase L1-like esterase
MSIGTAAALLSAELGLRFVGFEFQLYPTKVQFGWPDPITIEQRYRIDGDLLWVPKDYDSRVDPASQRKPSIVFMGDSCTEYGRYDTYLDAIVARRNPNRDYTYINLGVGGWSTYQGLAQMERDVVRLEPTIATIFFGWNDHWRSYGLVDKDIGTHYRRYAGIFYLLSRFRLVQLVSKGILALGWSESDPTERAPVRVSLADFESNLSSMVQIARENGIVPVLITAPTSHEVGNEPEYLAPRWLHDVDQLVPLHRKYVRAVRNVSLEREVALIDLFAEFGNMPREELRGYFNDDGIHLNEDGNRRMAELMYDPLRHLLFDPVADAG